MTFMSDKIFIDTHIWLYALIESDRCLEKHHKAKQCIAATENIIIIAETYDLIHYFRLGLLPAQATQTLNE